MSTEWYVTEIGNHGDEASYTHYVNLISKDRKVELKLNVSKTQQQVFTGALYAGTPIEIIDEGVEQ